MSKYNIVSVNHSQLIMLRIEINNKIIMPKFRPSGAYFLVNHMDLVEIFFEPWRIEPLVRFNQHLINYGLANINQWDHKLGFVFQQDWANDYFEKIIHYKKIHIGDSGNLDLNNDAYLGVDSFHWDIVDKLEKKI
jgi:hypothetical protein|tara:strand:+ start:57 stop:461 length:405 start_codon:yes stop_codon:yes gene_type:complete